MRHFDQISSIDIDKKTSWEDVLFLTFDIDWAHDEILNDTIDLVESFDIRATWFVTHNTPVLSRLKDNPKFELGIHPNFNFLLEGKPSNGKNAEEVIERVLDIVPGALSVRSHSMLQSSRLLDLFISFGLSYDVNHFIPCQCGIKLKPWKLWNGMNRVPYYWEDDFHCIYGLPEKMKSAINPSGLKVFDFHPIHVFLNTENLDRYEHTRHIHKNPKELLQYRYNGYGTRNRLIELMKFSNQL